MYFILAFTEYLFSNSSFFLCLCLCVTADGDLKRALYGVVVVGYEDASAGQGRAAVEPRNYRNPLNHPGILKLLLLSSTYVEYSIL